MKFVTLALIGLCAISAAAQSNTTRNAAESPIPGINLQTGCPIVFTDVALKTQARYMPVRDEADPDNSLAFKYKNQSGKQIQSIEIRVELKVKRSIYDLDTTTITRDMTLTGDTADTLPVNAIVYSLGRVTLQQVNYEGGKVWTPKATNTCNYQKASTPEQIAK